MEDRATFEFFVVRVECLPRGHATGAVLDAVLDDLFVRRCVRFKVNV